MARIRERAGQAIRFAGLAVSRPVEFMDRVAGRRERLSMATAPVLDAEVRDAVAAAHDLAGVDDDGCCRDVAEVRTEVLSRLDGEHHHDAGTSLAEMLWVLTRHRRPTHVIETGVARGVSSAFILDAMHRNSHGHLWSIDLPPMSPGWRHQTGVAVDPRLRNRWTYVRGASRRHLPRLAERVGSIDVFIHDGLHTAENMMFEMRTVWPVLSPGGLLIADDADDTDAVLRFGAEISREALLIREPNKSDVIAVFRRDG